MSARHALVVGGDRPFGAEIIARLCADRTVVVEDGPAPDLLVVNLLAETPSVAFRSVTENDFRASLDDGLYAFVAAAQTVVPRMTAGGAIVLVVPKDYLGSWSGVHVAATAAACVGMARSMAIELAPRGIRVNSVAAGRPGDAWDTPAARADVAATIAWLGGPDGSQVTGETILADRGASLQMAQAARR